MAYNKDNYEEQRLTPKQEKFVDRNTRRKDTISIIYRCISKSKKLDKK
jgi:hypothetical protein